MSFSLDPNYSLSLSALWLGLSYMLILSVLVIAAGKVARMVRKTDGLLSHALSQKAKARAGDTEAAKALMASSGACMELQSQWRLSNIFWDRTSTGSQWGLALTGLILLLSLLYGQWWAGLIGSVTILGWGLAWWVSGMARHVCATQGHELQLLRSAGMVELGAPPDQAKEIPSLWLARRSEWPPLRWELGSGMNSCPLKTIAATDVEKSLHDLLQGMLQGDHGVNYHSDGVPMGIQGVTHPIDIDGQETLPELDELVHKILNWSPELITEAEEKDEARG